MQVRQKTYNSSAIIGKFPNTKRNALQVTLEVIAVLCLQGSVRGLLSWGSEGKKAGRIGGGWKLLAPSVEAGCSVSRGCVSAGLARLFSCTTRRNSTGRAVLRVCRLKKET